MSRMKKLLLCSGTGLCVSIFLVCFTLAIINSKKSKESVDVLKNVDMSTFPNIVNPLIFELKMIAKRDGCLYEELFELRLAASWQKMYRLGKCSKEDMDAVIRLDEAIVYLREAVQGIGYTQSLRDKIRM